MLEKDEVFGATLFLALSDVVLKHKDHGSLEGQVLVFKQLVSVETLGADLFNILLYVRLLIVNGEVFRLLGIGTTHVLYIFSE